jgi:meso-butanediol dehydrogenase / (S,S)-butanediol dehydrogenase / diacetyl reductase
MATAKNGTDAAAAPVALVSGGGTGIGAAIARRMRRDGWEICVAARRREPIDAVAREVAGSAVVADVGSEDGAARAVHAALGLAGRLDAVICNAGTGAGGTVADQSLEHWDGVLRTNVTGAFLLCRAALPHLEAARGAVVTVASLAGLRAAPASAAYCASKAALVMLTQCIALDHGPAGVRANCICPGWIRTARADAEMDDLAGRRGTDREGAYELVGASAPLRRAGLADEVAEAAAWLAGPASSYVSGAVLTVDGGTAVVDPGTFAFRDEPGDPRASTG